MARDNETACRDVRYESENLEMLELSGMGGILRAIPYIYWSLAITALVLVAWKVKRGTNKAIGIAVVILVFGYLPAQGWLDAKKREAEAQKGEAYAREAWAYFKKKCDADAGEKIYKTFTDVKSVLVVKQLPPANDNALSDQFWLGDPYSNATPGERASSAALRLASQTLPASFGNEGRGFDFVESSTADTNNLVRYSYRREQGEWREAREIQPIDRPASRFGISWQDESTPEDRKYWVARSHLRIVDLTDDSIVAERIGYLIEPGFGSTRGQRLPWLAGRGPKSTCPEAHDYSDRWFVLKVLKPAEGRSNGK
jgi:hypothetical protein